MLEGAWPPGPVLRKALPTRETTVVTFKRGLHVRDRPEPPHVDRPRWGSTYVFRPVRQASLSHRGLGHEPPHRQGTADEHGELDGRDDVEEVRTRDE